EVGYTFGLTNRRSGPLKDVRFADSKLGVTLDGGQGRVELNGQAASELTLTYTTCDIESKELYAGTPTVCQTYAEIQNLIQTATNAYTTAQPLAAGSYVYTPRDETELLEILGWGIPANCKLSIRGFKHTLTAGEFINSLSTLCTPLEYDSVQNVAKALDPVSGAASCRSVGMDLTGVTGKPYRVVMDYGKPIEINLRKVDEFIAGESGISFQYVGSTFDGRHGLVRAKEPLNLIFKTGGEDYDRELGIFHMNDANILRYSPKGFMDRVDSFYAVYKVTMASQPNFVAYLFNAVEFLPAHTVYYEAEDFKSEISLTKKTTDKDTETVTLQNTWTEENLEKEGTPGGTVQDHVPLGEEVYIPDYRNHPEVLFFGFDNTPEDQERYSTVSSYGNRGNYDDPANCDILWYVYKERPTKVQSSWIDSSTGSMVIQARAQAEGTNAGDTWPDIFLDTIYGGRIADNYNYGYPNHPLNYNPKDAQVYQVRFKMKNFRIGTVGNEPNSTKSYPYVRMEYSTVTSGNPSYKKISDVVVHTDLLTAEKYVVMTLEIPEEFRTCGTVRRVRAYWGGLESISSSQLGELTVDYIYIGPRELAPVETTYGWDGSYRTDAKLSDGESLFVRGNGVRLPSQTPETAKNYTEMRFTFTGTGFDLISRTGEQQGACRVEVYKESDLTKAVKTLTVQNKGELELYQIPVVSVRDLEHGTYVVSVMVNDKVDSSWDVLKRGNEFYLDAIRIFDPIDVSAGPDATDENAVSAYAAYCADEEAYPVVQEVRDILLSATDFQALNGSTVGAVYVDMVTVPTETVPATDANGDPTGGYETVKPDLDVNNHITGTIATYEKVGPKNEVYLGPGQKIAFKLVVKSAELPKRVDVACKAVEGGSTSLSVVAVKNASDKFHGIRTPITSATAQYYSLTIWDKRFEADTDDANNPIHYIYVIIENIATSGVLSVTDVKVAYDCKPTLPAGVQPAAYSPEPAKRNATVELPADCFVDFEVDNHIMDVINSYIEGQKETVCDHEPGDWVVETPALPGQEGMRVSYCLRCGVPCKSETIAPISKLSFVGAAVSLQSDLAIHYKVKESYFTEMGYTDPFVVVNDNGFETIISDYRVKDGQYSFIYRNIAPHRIGDTVTATLYAYHGGKLYTFESRDYSVADYCYNMLSKTEGNDSYAKLRTLLVDILLYGAESQKYTNYKTDALCTARLTEDQLACGTAELTRELVNCRDQAYEVIDNPTVEWKGAGLNLRESVAVRFKISAESYEGLEVKITLEGRTETVKAEDFDYRADGAYVHFAGLNAAQLSEPIYVAAFRDGVQVSNTICYSV
ncbi:MAG: hypothetical protein IKM59_00790, partial [Oscillospiraceae bacterium]|nr:hypothetical protein [Oscillospiraceae bacterium]